MPMREYIATTRDGWGRAYTEYKAVATALQHTSTRDNVEIWVYCVEGFSDVWPGRGGILADEVHSEEHFVLDGREAENIRRSASDLEIAVEEALVNAS